MVPYKANHIWRITPDVFRRLFPWADYLSVSHDFKRDNQGIVSFGGRTQTLITVTNFKSGIANVIEPTNSACYSTACGIAWIGKIKTVSV